MDNEYLKYLEDIMGPVSDTARKEYEAVCERVNKAEHLASGLDQRASVLIGMLTCIVSGADHEKTLTRLQGVLSNRQTALQKVEELRRERAAVCARIARAQAMRTGEQT